MDEDHMRGSPVSGAASDAAVMRTSVAEDALLEDEEMGDCPEMYDECTDKSKYYVTRMSAEEYRIEGEVYTKAAVKALLQSKEYCQRYTRCTLCWSIWCEDMCTPNCMECGGYSMERPCPICQGRCGRIWKRDVEMSHSTNEAHWEGSCGLPEEEQRQFMFSVLMDESNDELVLDGMEQLST